MICYFCNHSENHDLKGTLKELGKHLPNYSQSEIYRDYSDVLESFESGQLSTEGFSLSEEESNETIDFESKEINNQDEGKSQTSHEVNNSDAEKNVKKEIHDE